MDCYVCREQLPLWWSMDRLQQDGWYQFNVAPDAASGGTMMPVHYRCRPLAPITITAQADGGGWLPPGVYTIGNIHAKQK